MTKRPQTGDGDLIEPFDISDDDVFEAMKDIEGFIDITPGDFKALYRLARG